MSVSMALAPLASRVSTTVGDCSRFTASLRVSLVLTPQVTCDVGPRSTLSNDRTLWPTEVLLSVQLTFTRSRSSNAFRTKLISMASWVRPQDSWRANPTLTGRRIILALSCRLSTADYVRKLTALCLSFAGPSEPPNVAPSCRPVTTIAKCV